MKTLADLKGKKVGFSISGFEDLYVAVLLDSVGLTTDEVTLINVNFNLTSSLLAGQVDAVIGAFRNFELTQLALQAADPGRYDRFGAFLKEEGLIDQVPAFDTYNVVPE